MSPSSAVKRFMLFLFCEVNWFLWTNRRSVCRPLRGGLFPSSANRCEPENMLSSLWNPLKSCHCGLIEMSITKGELCLKVDFEQFCFCSFIGTGSLISLKSPLIHKLFCLPVVCSSICVCVFTPDCRMFDHRFPREILVSVYHENSEQCVCEHLYKFVF